MNRLVAVCCLLLCSAVLGDDHDLPNDNNRWYWIDKGNENAARDLDKWPAIAAGIASGAADAKPALNEQLRFLKSQVELIDANDKTLDGSLKSLVSNLKWLADGSPNFIRRNAFKAMVGYVNGKRDHKSYYLMDGAANWVDKRTPQLAGSPAGEQLAQDMNAAKAAIRKTQETLDSSAQVYVQGIKDLSSLNDDVAKNIDRIRDIVNNLNALFTKSTFVPDSQAMVDAVAQLVNKWK